jgi:DNA-binding transcriptional regulator LsrR (DeoR family)
MPPLLKNLADHRLLSKIGTLYYVQNLTQQEIAARLHLSRPKVSRLLQQARDLGIVQISIVHTNGNHIHLESELERRYGLQEVLIVDMDEDDPSEQALKHHLGMAAAGYFERSIQPGDVVGIAWGTTLEAMIQSVHLELSGPQVHVVQVLGGIGPAEAKVHAADLSRRLASQIGGSLTLLQTPAIVSSRQVRDVLLADENIREAVAMFSRLTIAYVGIGPLETHVLPRADIEELGQAGAVGDIALRFFDEQGRPVNTSLADRLIAIGLDELNRAKTVVGVAGGERKYSAIRGALLGGHLDVLVTDSATARRLSSDPA